MNISGSVAIPSNNLAAIPGVGEDGVSCSPNIAPAGRRMRRRFGSVCAGIGAVALGASVALQVSWYWRALIFIPATASAIGFLQARRGTCVARAAEGTVEGDDLSRTKAADGDATRSRQAASKIMRDAALAGLLCAGAAAGTALIR